MIDELDGLQTLVIEGVQCEAVRLLRKRGRWRLHFTLQLASTSAAEIMHSVGQVMLTNTGNRRS